MTRDQALTIINNIELITAFAQGKSVGTPINGRVYLTNSLCLSNFRSDRPLNYVVCDDVKAEPTTTDK